MCRVTGAEAAMAVNNNAAALLLALSALAQGREVVISRGQLVEIGGGFRIPDVMAQSGATPGRGRHHEPHLPARLRGRHRRRDCRPYARPLEQLPRHRLHRVGVAGRDGTPGARARAFCSSTTWAAAASWTRAPTASCTEPTPQESLAAGADLVLFSGDKLLGGPQAGIIAGRRELIARLKRHPLARALRMDKASIAGAQRHAPALRERRGRARGARLAHDFAAPERHRPPRKTLGAFAWRRSSRQSNRWAFDDWRR